MTTAVDTTKSRTVVSRRPRERRGDGRTAFWFLLPALIGFVVFYLFPTIRGIYLSFTDWNLLSNTGEVIGPDNYQTLWADPIFWNSIRVTTWYVILNIGVQTVLAIGIAVMLDRFAKSSVMRSVTILPWLVPNVVVALLWLWLLDPNVGIVNSGIEFLGFEPIAFLGSPTAVIPTLAGINVWRHMGYTALLVFAGLQTIPRTLYEAAEVDGANEWQLFTRITAPLLRPVLALVLVITVIGSFQVFDTVNVATGGFGGRPGGPINASRVIYLYIFEKAFAQNRLGLAAAISVVLFVGLLVITIVQLRLLRASESDLSS